GNDRGKRRRLGGEMREPDDERQRGDEQNAAADAEHPGEDPGCETQADGIEDRHPMKILTATATSRTLKSRVRTRVGTFCCAQVPTRVPSIAGSPTSAASDQLTSPRAPYAPIPNRDVSPMAASDVPVAQRVE